MWSVEAQLAPPAASWPGTKDILAGGKHKQRHGQQDSEDREWIIAGIACIAGIEGTCVSEIGWTIMKF